MQKNNFEWFFTFSFFVGLIDFFQAKLWSFGSNIAAYECAAIGCVCFIDKTDMQWQLTVLFAFCKYGERRSLNPILEGLQSEQIKL